MSLLNYMTVWSLWQAKSRNISTDPKRAQHQIPFVQLWSLYSPIGQWVRVKIGGQTGFHWFDWNKQGHAQMLIWLNQMQLLWSDPLPSFKKFANRSKFNMFLTNTYHHSKLISLFLRKERLSTWWFPLCILGFISNVKSQWSQTNFCLVSNMVICRIWSST